MIDKVESQDRATVATPNQNQAARKRGLIAASLARLREANQIDEREDRVDDWVRWYDETIGDCNQIEIVAGAMRVELALRRGERIIAQGEQRGGDQTQSDTVRHFDSAERKGRERDRAIASEPEIVKDYIAGTVADGKVPSIRGALRLMKPSPTPRPNLHVHRWVCDCGATRMARPPKVRFDPGAHPFGCTCSALCAAYTADPLAAARAGKHPESWFVALERVGAPRLEPVSSILNRLRLKLCACGHPADEHHRDALENLLACESCDCDHFSYASQPAPLTSRTG